jgi:hypothetical protein
MHSWSGQNLLSSQRTRILPDEGLLVVIESGYARTPRLVNRLASLLFVAALLAAACGGSSAAATPTVHPTATPAGSSPEEMFYRTEAGKVAQGFVDEFTSVAGLFGHISLADPQWRGSVQAELSAIEALGMRWRRLSPPPSYRPYHQRVLDSLDLVDQALVAYRDGLNKLDSARIIAGNQLFDRATSAIRDANTLLPAPLFKPQATAVPR